MTLRPLHIIMPMAGEGSRFSQAGWITPKPLIELNGVPLFRHAISSVHDDDISMKYSFIVRQNHIDEYAIDKEILSIFPEANIFSVRKTTRGAVETCLMAENAIDDNDAVIVMDCDLEFRSKRFMELIKEALHTSGDEAEGGALYQCGRARLGRSLGRCEPHDAACAAHRCWAGRVGVRHRVG
jgi:choline kinase